VANDLRSDELDRAITQFTSASRIACLGGNVFDLDPRSAGTFDLVIACEVIEHVAHPDELLRTLARFVAPDGAILLTTPNGRYFRNQLPTFAQIGDPTQLEANQFKPDADGHLFLLTPGELAAMAADAGLQVEHILLWGTPFLSGGAGLRLLKGLLPNRACFWLEQSVQQLPASTRARLTNSISALLRPRTASAHS
jgi:2-polyprenyl-3-methyl-5-hydroxy-6-metoxy-1,4-benzoquinol methylase